MPITRGFIHAFILLIITSGSLTLRANTSDAKDVHTVQAVFDREYEPLLISLIQKSRVSIYASHFSFFTEKTFCSEIVQALIRAKERGVAITIFLEGNKKGSGERNAKTRKKLGKLGIDVVLNSSRKLAHAKLFVIDGEWVLAGSTNLSYSSMQKNNESNILVKSKVIARTLEKYIKDLVADSDREITTDSGMDKQIMAVTDGNFFPYALDLIRDSKEEICVTTYLFDYLTYDPDSYIARLFYELVQAKKRGVDIHIFLEQSVFNFNLHIHNKNLASAKFLRRNGVKNIRFDQPDRVTHCKIIISDKKRALLGSTNWYWHDLDSAHQVNFLIEEPRTVQQLTDYFEKLYNNGIGYVELKQNN